MGAGVVSYRDGDALKGDGERVSVTLVEGVVFFGLISETMPLTTIMSRGAIEERRCG
jgi:hypothetical protein